MIQVRQKAGFLAQYNINLLLLTYLLTYLVSLPQSFHSQHLPFHFPPLANRIHAVEIATLMHQD